MLVVNYLIISVVAGAIHVETVDIDTIFRSFLDVFN